MGRDNLEIFIRFLTGSQIRGYFSQRIVETAMQDIELLKRDERIPEEADRMDITVSLSGHPPIML